MPALNERQALIIKVLYGLNIDLAAGTDDDRRRLTKKIAQQFCFEFGADYGCKASTPTNPQSKDSIAKREGTKLYSWDWQNGATREPQVRAGSEAEDITGQFFITVEPANYLGEKPPVEKPPDNSLEDYLLAVLKEMEGDIKEIMSGQTAISESCTKILAELQVLIDKPPIDVSTIKYPEYTVKLPFFGDVTFKPKK